MVDNAPLIRKSRFPRQLTAFAVVGTNLVTYVVMLAILLVLSFAFIPEARGTEWLALPIAALLVCMAAGLALTLACLNVLYRDVEHLVAALLLPWFFLTPIIYSLSQFHHPRLTEVLRYANPIDLLLAGGGIRRVRGGVSARHGGGRRRQRGPRVRP